MHYNREDWIIKPTTKSEYSFYSNKFIEEGDNMSRLARENNRAANDSSRDFYLEKSREIRSLQDEWCNMFDRFYEDLPN